MSCPTCGVEISATDASCPRCYAPAPPPPLRLGARGYAIKGVGTAATVAVYVTALFNAGLWIWGLVGRSLAVRAKDQADPGLLDVVLIGELLLMLPYLLALVTAGVLTIVWCYRARKNLDVFPEAVTPIGAGWAIGGWLVPFVSLVMPYRVVANIARESLRRAVTPTSLKVWWAAWIAYLFLDRVVSNIGSNAYDALPTVLVGPADYQQYVDHYTATIGRQAIPLALLVLSTVTFGKVVQEISAAQQARIDGSRPGFHPTPGMAIPVQQTGTGPAPASYPTAG